MTLRPGGAPMNIANGIREFAIATPDATAVIDGERSLSYAALNERASRVANAMLAAGLLPGDRVAIVLGNRLEYAEIAAGLAKAGMPMVPINPRLTPTEIEYIVGHSESRGLIIDETAAPTASRAAEVHRPHLMLSLGHEYESVLENARHEDPHTEIEETEPFCIAYTSGTTGKPKGVVISHRSRVLTFYCTALEWGLGPARRTLAVAPMYHGAGFAFAYAAIHTGGVLSMLRAFDPEELLRMIERDKPHSVFLVPTHAQMIRGLGESAIARYDTSSLETLYFNAAPMPQELKLWVMDTFPHVGLHELYGSTEAGIVTNLRPPDQRRKERCVGPPWFLTEVRVVDTQGNALPPGSTGELFSRSPFLMNGYLHDPDATAECITSDGFLTSGDIVHIDDENYVYVVDRTKDMIISGGVNIYPREIEEVLATHPDVREAAVVGAPSEMWGEETVAFIVTESGSVEAEKLELHCRETLAGFKVPKRFEAIDALPRNPAGKVLKRDLRDKLAEESR